MEYIAIAIPNDETGKTISGAEIISNDYNLAFIRQDRTSIDAEVRSGVLSFIKQYNLFILKIIALSVTKQNGTSSDVSQNLIDYFLGNGKSNLIEFLLANKNILPRKYFILFAFEWYEGELCRYKKIKINELSNYFLENNSWYLWLYDYSKDYEKPDLDIPFVLEIDNE